MSRSHTGNQRLHIENGHTNKTGTQRHTHKHTLAYTVNEAFLLNELPWDNDNDNDVGNSDNSSDSNSDGDGSRAS